jgi:type 2 lantibiotic biosynthesis protein LanM
LLNWLNQRGVQPAFRIMTLLDRGTYGWSEFVLARPCSSVAELERFYQRQGGYLALFYALEATDVHYENLIAAGEHPVMIDLEALFHPRIKFFNADQPQDPAVEQIANSVLRVGLLPQRIWSSEDYEGIDLSGLNGKAGQLSPTPAVGWQGIGTDQMQLVRQRIPLGGSLNRPTLNGQAVEACDYIVPLMDGFRQVYKLLIAHREELIDAPLAAFAQDEIRLIVRASHTYARLLQESYHPDLLRDALDRDRFFDNLWVAEERQPSLSRLIPAELADLLNGDIPIFTTTTTSLDVFSSRGEKIPDFLDTTGLELAQNRLRNLSERDLNRQLWFIQASFATVDEAKPVQLKKVEPEFDHTPRARFLAEAQAIGNRLSELAISDQTNVNWVGLNMMKEHDWRIMAAGLDLYNGLPGIIFYLAYLGHITGQENYTALARAALETLNRNVEPAVAHFTRVGGYEGSGALVYLYSHLGQLWNEPAFFQRAEQIVSYMPEFIAEDTAFDLMAGSAGCILSLLSLYKVSPSDATLRVAIQAGERLLSCVRPMSQGVGWATHLSQNTALAGLGHGNAGIALSLFQLYATTGEKRFYQTAEQALAYERRLFSEPHQNWLHLLKIAKSDQTKEGENDSSNSEHFMTAWCHGATGIGLGRLASLPFSNDAIMLTEIDAAVKTTLKKGFGHSHSLCHGDFGSIELLLTASQILDEPSYRHEFNRWSKIILDEITTYGWQTGMPTALESPGLMLGLSGIGYSCLRLVEPERVPCLLVLEPPRIILD